MHKILFIWSVHYDDISCLLLVLQRCRKKVCKTCPLLTLFLNVTFTSQNLPKYLIYTSLMSKGFIMTEYSIKITWIMLVIRKGPLRTCCYIYVPFTSLYFLTSLVPVLPMSTQVLLTYIQEPTCKILNENSMTKIR